MTGPLNKERRTRQVLAKATMGLPPFSVAPVGAGSEEARVSTSLPPRISSRVRRMGMWGQNLTLAREADSLLQGIWTKAQIKKLDLVSISRYSRDKCNIHTEFYLF